MDGFEVKSAYGTYFGEDCVKSEIKRNVILTSVSRRELESIL